MKNSDTSLARDRVLADLKALAEDAEALLRATGDDVSDVAKAARVRLATALEKAKATCEELRVRGLESVKVAGQKVDGCIRDHPYESVAVAFGVGVLLGLLLKRR